MNNRGDLISEARLLVSIGRNKEAHDKYREVLDIDPDDEEAQEGFRRTFSLQLHEKKTNRIHHKNRIAMMEVFRRILIMLSAMAEASKNIKKRRQG